MMSRILPLLFLAAVLVGCSPDAGSTEPTGWTKTAGQTFCSDWIDTLTIEDRNGLARAMIEKAWDRAGAGEHPPDAVVTKFANAIGTVCTNAPSSETVSDVASALYELSDDLKP